MKGEDKEDLNVRLEVELMIKYGYAALRQFPKSEKYVLAADIRQCMYRLLRLVIVTNRRYYKKTTMQDLDAELDLLRSLVRLANELKFLPFRQYEIWAEHTNKIGGMVGAWLEWVHTKGPGSQPASEARAAPAENAAPRYKAIPRNKAAPRVQR